MGLLDELAGAGRRIPGAERMQLILASGDTVNLFGRPTEKSKEEDGAQLQEINLYTKRVPSIGDRVRRIGDGTLFEIVEVETTWRGARQQVKCTRLRSRGPLD